MVDMSISLQKEFPLLHLQSLFEMSLSLHRDPGLSLANRSWLSSPSLPTSNQSLLPWILFYSHDNQSSPSSFLPDYFKKCFNWLPNSQFYPYRVPYDYIPSFIPSPESLVNQHCLSDHIKGVGYGIQGVRWHIMSSHFSGPSIRIPFHVSNPRTLNYLLLPEATIFQSAMSFTYAVSSFWMSLFISNWWNPSKVNLNITIFVKYFSSPHTWSREK